MIGIYRLKKLFSTVTLTLNKENKVAYLTLTNSKKRNPLSLETITLFSSKLTQIQKCSLNGQIKIAIIKGQGTVFSAGHDLKQLKTSKNPFQIFQECSKMMLKLKSMPIPIICAINGIAAAAGFQLAMACDILLATKKSSFSTPGIKWGLFCSTPGVQLIRSINSQKKAKQMLLFGESISADEAFQYGIVNKVVNQESDLQTQINTFILKANGLSSEVIKLGKQILRKQKNQNIENAYCIANDGMKKNIMQKEDCQQGLTAFSQKRHPHFKS